MKRKTNIIKRLVSSDLKTKQTDYDPEKAIDNMFEESKPYDDFKNKNYDKSKNITFSSEEERSTKRKQAFNMLENELIQEKEEKTKAV